MNLSPEEKFQGLLLALGQATGGLSDSDSYARLVASIAADDLRPEYIVMLRDKLTEALRQSGIEAVPTSKPVEFDCALNSAGWAFIEAMPCPLPGHAFNNVKPALKVAIEKWLSVRATLPPTVNQSLTVPISKSELIQKLRLLSGDMFEMAVAMDYYGGTALWAQHKVELLGASRITKEWVIEIEAGMPEGPQC